MKSMMKSAVVLFACLLAASCRKQPAVIGQTDARLVFHFEQPHRFTRALTTADENVVTEVHVLIFDRDNTLVEIRKATQEPRGYVLGILPESPAMGRCNFVILANAGSIIRQTIGFDIEAMDPPEREYGRVAEAIYCEILDSEYTNRGVALPIPMWSQTGPVHITPGAQEFTLRLLRAVARIDVGVGQAAIHTPEADHPYVWDGRDAEGNPIPFELTEVYVMRPNSHFALIPAGAHVVGDRVTAPTVPALASAFSIEESIRKFHYRVDNALYTTQDIYIPAAKLTTGTSGDALHTRRMAVVVGGRYNASPQTSYYRLDFLKGQALCDVLRNHVYGFNISSVQGPGYGSPQEAYSAASMNMTADVVEWIDGRLDNVVLSGGYYLLLGRHELVFGPGMGQCKEVVIQTNVLDFQLQLTADKSVTLGARQGDEHSYTSALGYGYRLERQGENDIYTLTVTSPGNISETPTEKHESWTLLGRDMHIPFEVSQRWEQAQTQFVLAPPGVLGVTRSGKLTLRGAVQYSGTQIERQSEFGPLEEETVYLLHFKWGSPVGIYSRATGGDLFDASDVAWTPSVAQGHIGMDALKAQIGTKTGDAAWDLIPNKRVTTAGWTEDLGNGYGDPCLYADRGTATGQWGVPLRETSRWSRSRFQYPAPVSPMTISFPGGGQAIGLVPGRGDELDGSMFMPMAGFRVSGGTHWYPGERGYYWSISIPNANNYPAALSFELFRPDFLHSTMEYFVGGVPAAFPIRCVRM